MNFKGAEMWNLKKLKDAKAKNLIKIDTDQILQATLYIRHRQELSIILRTYKGRSIFIPISKIHLFFQLFNADGDTNNYTTLNEYEGKYIRTVEYIVPEEEMHQLSDPIEDVGIMHIVDDRLLILDEKGDKIHVREFEQD